MSKQSYKICRVVLFVLFMSTYFVPQNKIGKWMIDQKRQGKLQNKPERQRAKPPGQGAGKPREELKRCEYTDE